VIRAACVDTHQPEPLPAAAFSAFTAALNSLVRDPLPQPVVAVPGPDVVEDEMRRFDDDRPRAADYRERIVTELRAVLTPAADQPEHVIALDHADNILGETFDEYLYPHLIRPIADTPRSRLRLLLVAPEDWLRARLPAEDQRLRASVSVGDFEAAQFTRLARDYCRRHGYEFDDWEGLFTEVHKKSPHSLPVWRFDKVIDMFPDLARSAI
jgi:hypothetical protein